MSNGAALSVSSQSASKYLLRSLRDLLTELIHSGFQPVAESTATKADLADRIDSKADGRADDCLGLDSLECRVSPQVKDSIFECRFVRHPDLSREESLLRRLLRLCSCCFGWM